MRRFASVTLLCLLVACASKYHLNDEDLRYPSPWPFHHGDLAAQGAVGTGEFSGQLQILWERRVSGKPVGPLTIYYDVLVYPGAKYRIKFFDTDSGEYLGYLKSRGFPQTGVVIRDSLAFFATAPPRNRLCCVNLRNGKTLWKLPIKDATAGSIIVENNLIVSTTNGVLTAYRLEDGHQLWRLECKNGYAAPPAYRDGKIFQPDDAGILHVVSFQDGTELYQVEVAGPMMSAVAVSDMILAADMRGNVYAIDADSGDIVWTTALNGPVWTTPAVADGRVFVGHSGGGLAALEEKSGRLLWRFDAGEVIKASPIVVGDYVVVGTLGGKLFALRAADGELLEQIQLDGAIAFPPVTDGTRVYVATESGKITCLGWNDEHNSSTDQ
jgi:outer membrane protein assembly factor BamB